MRRRAARAMVLVAAALLPVAAFAQPPASPAPSPSPGLAASRLQAVESAINVAMHRYGIPGLSAAVAASGSVSLSAGYGMSDLENAVPATPFTIYRLASLSKPLTATAVLQLAAKGKLDLDAPVQRYVPAYPEKQWPLTCRQLLCHQAGVRQWTDEEFHNTRHYASLTDALEFFKNDPLVFEPGTRTLYTSLGYNLLGAAVENASGQDYLDYMRENVFTPAGMETAGLDDVFALIPHRAQGYQKAAGGELLNSALSDTSNRVPGGGLVGTAEDLARFVLALHSGALLKKETREQMFVRQRTRDGKPTGYGLGWAVGTQRGRREVYHIGGQPRVSTVLYFLPESDVAVVFLTNLEGVGTPLLELARQVADIALSPKPLAPK